jgi:hypothetical protein
MNLTSTLGKDCATNLDVLAYCFDGDSTWSFSLSLVPSFKGGQKSSFGFSSKSFSKSSSMLYQRLSSLAMFWHIDCRYLAITSKRSYGNNVANNSKLGCSFYCCDVLFELVKKSLPNCTSHGTHGYNNKKIVM